MSQWHESAAQLPARTVMFTVTLSDGRRLVPPGGPLPESGPCRP